MREPPYSLALIKEISQVSYRQVKHNASNFNMSCAPLFMKHWSKISDKTSNHKTFMHISLPTFPNNKKRQHQNLLEFRSYLIVFLRT